MRSTATGVASIKNNKRLVSHCQRPGVNQTVNIPIHNSSNNVADPRRVPIAPSEPPTGGNDTAIDRGRSSAPEQFVIYGGNTPVHQSLSPTPERTVPIIAPNGSTNDMSDDGPADANFSRSRTRDYGKPQYLFQQILKIVLRPTYPK